MMRRLLVIIGWALYSALVLVAEVLVYPLAPLAVAFVDAEGRLPVWARWMETHDFPGWAGPLSEGYPATRWGLTRWLWRNRAYGLSNVWRCSPEYGSMQMRERGTRDPVKILRGSAWWLGTISDASGRWWFSVEAAVTLRWFTLLFRAGWKLQGFFDGERPADPQRSAIGMQVLSIATRTLGDPN